MFKCMIVDGQGDQKQIQECEKNAYQMLGGRSVKGARTPLYLPSGRRHEPSLLAELMLYRE